MAPPLTKEHKKKNRELASKGVANKNGVGILKQFKIIADNDRNRQKNGGSDSILFLLLITWNEAKDSFERGLLTTLTSSFN